jgi:hypothetical protein
MVVVVIAIANVPATLACLFQFMPAAGSLPAVGSMLALCFTQIFFCFVDAVLAFVVTIARLRRNQTAQRQKCHQQHCCSCFSKHSETSIGVVSCTTR